MLPLRFAIFASLATVCLWGLFSLLDNLRKPELLRSPKLVIVKGCDPIDSAEAARLCPQLFCQKAVLDAKLVPLQATFEVTLQQRAQTRQLIAGAVRSPPATEHHFACILEHHKVVAARLTDLAELDTLAAQRNGWSL